MNFGGRRLREDVKSAMTLNLDPNLEAALTENARKRGMAPEQLAIDFLRRKFLPIEPLDEWERQVGATGVDTGVIPTERALSREELYD